MPAVVFVQVLLEYESFVNRPYADINIDMRIMFNYMILVILVIMLALVKFATDPICKFSLIIFECFNLLLVVVSLIKTVGLYVFLDDVIKLYCNNYIDLIILYAMLLLTLLVHLYMLCLFGLKLMSNKIIMNPIR